MAEDNTSETFHPCLAFLAGWLDSEQRAVTSHQIGAQLVTCAKAALSLGDNALFARFLAGFYKGSSFELSIRAKVHFMSFKEFLKIESSDLFL